MTYLEWRAEWETRGPWRLTPAEVQMLLDELDRRPIPLGTPDRYTPDDREPMGGDPWWNQDPR